MHSYICIAAFHLGTIDEPREGCDVEAEPEDGDTESGSGAHHPEVLIG